MLIEIHIIQNHAPANLNRDDTGSPKECVFGGARRGRISSQCLKRSIRRSSFFQENLSLKNHLATRTRRLPELIRERFLEHEDLREFAETAAIKVSGFGTKEGKERVAEKDGKFATAQTMFLTNDDVNRVFDVIAGAARQAKTVAKFKKTLASELQKQARQQGFRPISVDVALFGRMVTSEAFRDVQATAQVAHALSTHKVAHEFDYFTAVDDLSRTDMDVEEDAGADMIGDVEFNSACYYKYFSIDRDGLIDNLVGRELREADELTEDDEAQASELAAATLEAFVRAAAMVSPSGKQNSFAAHQLPAAILVEVRPNRSPVSYANAFVKPVSRGAEGLVTSSLEEFKKHVQALTNGFSLKADHRWLLAPEFSEYAIDGVTRSDSLDDLCKLLAETVKGGSSNG